MEIYLIILSVIVLLLILFVGVFVLFRKNPSLAAESYKSLVADQRENNRLTNEELKSLRIRIDKDTERIRQLENKAISDHRLIMELETRLTQYETFGQDMPFAYWMKDNAGIMRQINDKYEQLFMIPRGTRKDQYIGKTDIQYWGDAIGQAYHSNDMKIISGEEDFFMGVEPIFIGNTNVSEKFLIIKWAEYLGKSRMGVAGFAIPLKGVLFKSLKIDKKFVEFLIETDRIEDALSSMKEMLDNEYQSEIIQLQNRYGNLTRDNNSGILSVAEMRQEKNIIVKSILGLIRDSQD